jgi:hypothetical protein
MSPTEVARAYRGGELSPVEVTQGCLHLIDDKDGDIAAFATVTAERAVVGKTRTHELAYGVATPPTRNPVEVTRMPGGSSGGSAAALAAGMCMGAVGTDTAGSVRIPQSGRARHRDRPQRRAAVPRGGAGAGAHDRRTRHQRVRGRRGGGAIVLARPVARHPHHRR